MKFEVLRSELGAALANCWAARDAKGMKPGAAFVRLSVYGSALTLTATDSQSVEIQETLRVTESSNGSVLIGEHLVGICRDGVGDSVRLDEDGDKINISCGAAKWSVPIPANVDEFPAFKDFESVAVVKAETKKAVRAFRMVSFAQDTESPRYALGGVLVEGEGRMVATDSRRLSVCSMPLEAISGDWPSVVIPAKAVALISRVCARAEGDVTLTTDGTSVRVEAESGEWSVRARLVEGRFPAWRDVMSGGENGDIVVETNAGALLTAIKQASICADAERPSVVFETPEEGVLQVSSSGASVGLSDVTVPVVSDGVLNVELNNKYVTDWLRNLDAVDPVRIRHGEGRAVLFCDDSGSLKYLVMPLEAR